ncbi:MAG: nucleotide exchange factor GrpE [Waddliaceae bacterium]|nr:nucleotide exchange factor GrpE [Waddliaceae bacterium]
MTKEEKAKTKSEGEEQEAKPQEQEAEAKIVSISEAELAELRNNAEDFKNKHLRALAESENTRKRMQKERQDLTKYAIEGVILDFLQPFDQMERALGFADQMSDEVKNWAMGFQMILGQFKDVLSQNGVKPFKSIGEQFDPHKHEAVETVETDEHTPDTIVEELSVGYMMGERVIRPAKVKVAKANKVSSEEKTEEEANKK